MTYDLSACTWGMELEFGDALRTLVPPNATWSLRETDIVNILPPYYGIAVDPAGINPPVGGELNTTPSTTIKKQVEIVAEILDFFKRNGREATTSCISQTHVHVHIPGLTDDLMQVRKLLAFAYVHQDDIIRYARSFNITEEMSDYALEYLITDQCQKYTEDGIKTILRSSSFQNLFSNLVINKDQIQKYGCPQRYYINFATLQDNETVEFRFFRGTVDIEKIDGILNFCYSISDAAFNGGKIDYSIDLPSTNYDHALFSGWEKTKHTIITTEMKRRKRIPAIT